MSGPTPSRSQGVPLEPLSAPLFHAAAHETGHGLKVIPARAHVNGHANPFFRFNNNTRFPGWLFLPPQITGGSTAPVALGEHSWLQVDLHGGGDFPYVVVLQTDHGFVSVPGESDPVIIIDPPCP